MFFLASVGVITLYRAQVHQIHKLLSDCSKYVYTIHSLASLIYSYFFPCLRSKEVKAIQVGSPSMCI